MFVACAAGMDTGATSWLDSGSGSSNKVSALQLSTAVAGEMIEVLISLSNPLAVDLHVSRLRLLFEAEPVPEGADLRQYAEVYHSALFLRLRKFSIHRNYAEHCPWLITWWIT